jgi:hypothetical protein
MKHVIAIFLALDPTYLFQLSLPIQEQNCTILAFDGLKNLTAGPTDAVQRKCFGFN